MVMEFSLINVNLNIDRRLLLFMCGGLMLTIVLSDESNPLANVLRALPPFSLIDRYVIPAVKSGVRSGVGLFRGYASLYGGGVGAKVPFDVVDGFLAAEDGRGGSGDSNDVGGGRDVGRDGRGGVHDVGGGGAKDVGGGVNGVGGRGANDVGVKDAMTSMEDEGLLMSDEEALSGFSRRSDGGPEGKQLQGRQHLRQHVVDEEAMPKTRREISDEQFENAHESAKYAGGKRKKKKGLK